MRLAGFFTRGGSILALCIAVTSPAAAGTVADRVLHAGRLRCGVIAEPLDWTKDDPHGDVSVLDTQICRAVATAMLGSPDRFDRQTYPGEHEGLAALHAGASDIVAGTTPSAHAAATYSVRFSMPYFQDGLTIMVRRAEGAHSLADLAGRKLCFIDGEANSRIVLSVMAARGIQPIPFPFQEEGEMDAAIVDRHCQATAALISKLAEARAGFAAPADYEFLPDTLALVPLAVAVGADEARLAGIVDSTISALLQAEFLGVSMHYARLAQADDDPRMEQLLGGDWSTAQALGLDHAWSRAVIAAVGNYAEIHARTVGRGTKMNLQRGVNGLWNQGGVMTPLPLQ